jgi:hypothetical protein
VAGSLLWTQLAERYDKTVAVCDDAGRCEMRGVRLGQPRHSELEVEKPVHPEPSANSSSRGTPSGWAVRYENSIRMRWRASRAVGIILESMIHDCRPHESAREILADFWVKSNLSERLSLGRRILSRAIDRVGYPRIASFSRFRICLDGEAKMKSGRSRV